MGRVFIYKHNAANDTWDLAHELMPLRNQSNFGYSVDMHGPSIIVGANGFYKNLFENHQSFDARMSRKYSSPRPRANPADANMSR